METHLQIHSKSEALCITYLKTAIRRRWNEQANLRTLFSEDEVIKDLVIKNQTGCNY